MDKAKLRSYAALIARMGVNVQPGQEVVIRTAPEQLEFVEMVVHERDKFMQVLGGKRKAVSIYAFSMLCAE